MMGTILKTWVEMLVTQKEIKKDTGMMLVKQDQMLGKLPAQAGEHCNVAHPTFEGSGISVRLRARPYTSSPRSRPIGAPEMISITYLSRSPLTYLKYSKYVRLSKSLAEARKARRDEGRLEEGNTREEKRGMNTIKT
jgi:hypothetical protein